MPERPLTYFSSEKAGLIEGIDAIYAHHEGSVLPLAAVPRTTGCGWKTKE